MAWTIKFFFFVFFSRGGGAQGVDRCCNVWFIGEFPNFFGQVWVFSNSIFSPLLRIAYSLHLPLLCIASYSTSYEK